MDELQEHVPIELEDIPKRGRIATIVVCISLAIVIALGWYLSSAPADFPVKTFLRVRDGETLTEITDKAELLHIVRSSALLKVAVKIFGNDRKLASGDYYFDRPVSFWTVAHYLATGNFNIKPAKVILYEGITRKQMAERLAKDLPYFDSETFIKKTENKEGYLFPDTYFISPAADTDEVISLLENSYEQVVAPLREKIAASGMTEHEVITLASLVEKEAFGLPDRTTIAGILLHRLDIGMRLQVDATALYYLNKTNGTVEPEDLKVDSPYNTYLNEGLPPGPIGSPSKASILAVLNPVKTSYLFYLHDRYGIAHYAKTFAEHKRNIQRYLVN